MVGGKSLGERVFNASNIVFMIVLMFVTIYPFWYAVISSLNGGADLIRGPYISLAPAIYMGKLADRFGGSWTASGDMDHRIADRHRYVRVHPVHGDVRLCFFPALFERERSGMRSSDLPACILAAD